MQMTEITIYKIQRAVTPKAGNNKSYGFHSAHCLVVLYICIKYGPKDFQVTQRTNIHCTIEITTCTDNVQSTVTQKKGNPALYFL